MLIDNSKTHLYAPIEGEQYVDLAPERAKAGVCKVAVHLVRVADCCQQLGAEVFSDLGGGGICSGDCLEVHILPPCEGDQDRRSLG